MKKSIKITLISLMTGAALWLGAGFYSNSTAKFYTKKAEQYNFLAGVLEEAKESHAKEIERYKKSMGFYQKQANLAKNKGDEESYAQYLQEALEYATRYENGKDSFAEWDNLIASTQKDTKLFKEKSKKWENIADIINPF